MHEEAPWKSGSVDGDPPRLDPERHDAIVCRARALRRRQTAPWAGGVVLLVLLVVVLAAVGTRGSEPGAVAVDPGPESPVSTVVTCVGPLRVVEITIENTSATPLVVEGAQFAGPYSSPPGFGPAGVPETPDPTAFGDMVVFGSPADPGGTVRISGAINGPVVGTVMVLTVPTPNADVTAGAQLDPTSVAAGAITEIVVDEPCGPVDETVVHPDGSMTQQHYELTPVEIAALIGYTRARTGVEIGSPCSPSGFEGLREGELAFGVATAPAFEGGPCVVLGYFPEIRMPTGPRDLFDAFGNCFRGPTWYYDEEMLRMLEEREARLEQHGLGCPG